MKILKRVLCLSLVLLMLIPLLVACGDKEKGAQNEGANKDLLAQEMPEDGVGFQDFGGRDVLLLGFNAASTNEFEVDAEDTGTTLKAAVYARNSALEGRLNVKLKWDYINGHSGYEPEYTQEAGQRAAQGKVDIFTPYSQAGAWLMMNGITRDLNGIQYLNLKDEWWEQSYAELGSVNGRLYFVGGDISWTLMGNTIGFCFNKDILSQKAQVLDQFDVTSMYELVDQGKWTLENFIKISRDVAAKNTYGFTSYIVPMDAFYKACDLNWLEVNANGQQELSADQSSGKTNTALQMLSTFFRTDAAAVRLAYDLNLNYATNNGNKSNPSNPEWQNGQALFVLNAMLSITDFKFTELGFDFGVLPMPKFDQAQAEYKTIPDYEFSIVAVPRTVQGEKLNEVGAVLQVMASEGKNRISKPYFEEVMKKQEADSADDYTMWETIKDSVELDGGRMFTGSLQGDPNSHPTGIAFRRSLQLLKNTINEQWDGGKEKAQGLIVKMNNDLQKIESKYN
jgi:hypothetical protein